MLCEQVSSFRRRQIQQALGQNSDASQASHRNTFPEVLERINSQFLLWSRADHYIQWCLGGAWRPPTQEVDAPEGPSLKCLF